MLFVEQAESESPSDGGGYYAVYKDYIGRLGDNSYDAENQILFDDYIFSNEHWEHILRDCKIRTFPK